MEDSSGESHVKDKEKSKTQSGATGTITELPKYANQSFAPPISNKLDNQNYLTRKMQVKATVRGYNLGKFLEGGKHIPRQFLILEDEANDDLRSIKKSGLEMDEFLLKIKKIVDSLAAIGSPISEHEHIEIVLDALPSDYEGFVTSFSMKSDILSITEVESLLLTQEARLEAIRGSNDNISANVAQTRPSAPNFRPPSSFSTQNNAATLAQTQNQFNRPPAPTSAPMEALIAAPETLYDSAWYPNSGASNHITNDSTNLRTQQPYTGHEHVHTANGSGLAFQI
ncbi:Retrovirus-related Pol polyprotein from transposon TNT 1-94 [Senna tora]|uniref:Retrovirus-related Pol polyprotein from transposon TNT 1-94 n=1 Tax=Senna tora TaxID=362788 RepID=A0A834SIY0_9FABA|nr:Retrovirus-related Pol polyprotein from transposon TNT 1-94 [Senna tora]